MMPRTLQFFSVLALFCVVSLLRAAELQPGSSAHLVFRDVDDHEQSTAAGRVVVITVVTRQNEDEAQAVADRMPDHCIGDPKYRYITLVNFQRKLGRPLQGLTRAIIRKRLDAEAKKLKADYVAKKISRNPREDVIVVADFDGAAVTQLGLSPDSNNVAVFVFDGRGKLIQRWPGLPSADSLGKAVAAAR